MESTQLQMLGKNDYSQVSTDDIKLVKKVASSKSTLLSSSDSALLHPVGISELVSSSSPSLFMQHYRSAEDGSTSGQKDGFSFKILTGSSTFSCSIVHLISLSSSTKSPI